MQPIRTKLHQLLAMVRAGENLHFLAEKGGTAPSFADYKVPTGHLTAFLEYAIDTTPKFVFDSDLMQMIARREFELSLLDMQKAGVMNLPFPAMFVEFSTPGCHYICLLRDTRQGSTMAWEVDEKWAFPFYAMTWQIQKDAGGEYVVASPCIIFTSVEENQGQPWLRFVAEKAAMYPGSDELVEYTGRVYEKAAGVVWHALASALLTMMTEGISKDVIECEKLNRKRVQSNKPPIPRHTYIHIGRVYKSATGTDTDAYMPGRSPRPHWRRAHSRRVAFGAGRTERKWQFFPGRIVALPKDTVFNEADVPVPEYHVRK